jgi:hypothetical protein
MDWDCCLDCRFHQSWLLLMPVSPSHLVMARVLVLKQAMMCWFHSHQDWFLRWMDWDCCLDCRFHQSWLLRMPASPSHLVVAQVLVLQQAMMCWSYSRQAWFLRWMDLDCCLNPASREAFEIEGQGHRLP